MLNWTFSIFRRFFSIFRRSFSIFRSSVFYKSSLARNGTSKDAKKNFESEIPRSPCLVRNFRYRGAREQIEKNTLSEVLSNALCFHQTALFRRAGKSSSNPQKVKGSLKICLLCSTTERCANCRKTRQRIVFI